MPEPISASRISRQMSCHASANLELAIEGWTPPVVDPDKDNAANRGTHIHEVFAKVMEFGARDLEKISEAIAYVAKLRKRRRFNVMIEEPMVADWLPSKPGTTADLVLYVQDELHIIDLKSGKIPVAAVGNEQLLFYAATYGHLAPKATEVHLHIVQPWADVVDEWIVPSVVIAAFMNHAITAHDAIHAGSTQFVPGDHCQFCSANPHGRGLKGHPFCPAMMQLLYPQVGVDEDEFFNL
jgi:hypothetical protein